MIRVLVVAATEPARRRLTDALATADDLVVTDADIDVVLHERTGDDAWPRGVGAPEDEPHVVELVRDDHGDTSDLDDPTRDAPRGRLPANATPEELTAAIRAVAAGLVVRVPDARFSRERRGAAIAGAPPLSGRERVILAHLASGASNKRIADELGISDQTVKTHLATIFAKLGVASRTEAVTRGVRLGLVML